MTRRSRNSSRYLGRLTQADLDHASIPARPITDDEIAELPILDLAEFRGGQK